MIDAMRKASARTMGYNEYVLGTRTALPARAVRGGVTSCLLLACYVYVPTSDLLVMLPSESLAITRS